MIGRENPRGLEMKGTQWLIDYSGAVVMNGVKERQGEVRRSTGHKAHYEKLANRYLGDRCALEWDADKRWLWVAMYDHRGTVQCNKGGGDYITKARPQLASRTASPAVEPFDVAVCVVVAIR